jgi:hypothetical protein
MSRPLGRFHCLVLVVVSLSLLGCRDDGLPKRAPVSGKVTYNGTPLAHATINFYPEQSGERVSVGETDEKGEFTVWCYEKGDGAVLGKHKVGIRKEGPPKPTGVHPSQVAEGMDESWYEEMGQSFTRDPLIPSRYFSPDTSELAVEVVAGRRNTFEFHLEGTP